MSRPRLDGANRERGPRLYRDGGKIDTVISDLVMPPMDCIELIQRVRRHPANLPAIALTGSPANYIGTKAFDAFLRKPADLDQLCKAAAVQASGAAAAAAAMTLCK